MILRLLNPAPISTRLHSVVAVASAVVVLVWVAEFAVDFAVDTVVYIVDNSSESRYYMPLFNPLFCKNNMQGFRHRYPTHRNNFHQLL